jgi:DNA-binding MarR family transcriptional regulator
MATKWLTADQERAWRGFLFAHLRLEARLSKEMGAGSELSYPDYLILVALTDHKNSMRLFELSEDLGWEKSRISHHVARMAARGLLTKLECPSDRRGTTIEITTFGLSQLRAEAPHHVAAVRRFFIDSLTPAQLDALTSLSDVVAAALDAPQTPDLAPVAH